MLLLAQLRDIAETRCGTTDDRRCAPRRALRVHAPSSAPPSAMPRSRPASDQVTLRSAEPEAVVAVRHHPADVLPSRSWSATQDPSAAHEAVIERAVTSAGRLDIDRVDSSTTPWLPRPGSRRRPHRHRA